MQVLDQFLAAAVARMRLAREHDLERLAPRYRLQALEVGEQEIGALVRRHAPRKSEERERRIERLAARAPDALEERRLRFGVRLP